MQFSEDINNENEKKNKKKQRNENNGNREISNRSNSGINK